MSSLKERIRSDFLEFPFKRATGLTEFEIVEAENKLGVAFDKEYRRFIIKYGGAIVGAYPVYGLKRAESMDINLWSVVDVTMNYRNEHWFEDDILYVISTDHAGNPIGFNKEGILLVVDHDFGEIVEFAKTFKDFLEECYK